MPTINHLSFSKYYLLGGIGVGINVKTSEKTKVYFECNKESALNKEHDWYGEEFSNLRLGFIYRLK